MLRVRLADTGWTSLALAVAGPATLQATATAAADGCQSVGLVGTGVVCPIGAMVEAVVEVVLRPVPLWWQQVPDPGAAGVAVRATLYSAAAPGADRARHRNATLALRIAAPDVAVEWREGLQGLSLQPDAPLPVAAVVTNTGPGWAEGVGVAITFHPGLNVADGAALEPTFAPAYDSPAVCSVGAADAACALGALAPGTRVTLAFARLRTGPVVPDALPFEARVTSATPDAAAANDAATLWLSPYGAQFRMAPDAGRVDVAFTDALDLRAFDGGATFDVDCRRVLGAAALALVGPAPACALAGPRLLRVAFGARPALLPGMSLALSPDLRPLRCAAQPCLGFRQFTGVVTADPMPPPEVTLQAPAYAGPCRALRLDASPGLVTTRFYNVSWSAARAAPAPAAARTALARTLRAAAGAGGVTVPPTALADGTYEFRVEVVDHFGRSRAATQRVTRAARLPPALTLTHAGALTVYAREPVVLGADARATGDCQGPPRAVLYHWECASEPGLLAEVNTSGPSLRLPAYTLLPGSSYLFWVRAVDATTALSTAESVSVTVLRHPLHVRLAGGLVEDLPVGAALRLDASGSRDPDADAAAGGAGGLTFEWALCTAGDALDVPVSGACTAVPLGSPPGGTQPPPAFAGLAGTGTAVLTASPAATVGWAPGWVKFVVRVTAEGRAAEAQKWVRVSARSRLSPVLAVAIASAAGGRQTPILHTSGGPLVLRALVATARATVNYTWGVWDRDGTAVALGDPATAPSGARGGTLALNATRLVLPPYAVRVEAAAGEAAAEAWARVEVAPPPAPGRLVAAWDAATGAVALRAVGWGAQAPALLRYRFALRLTAPSHNVTHVFTPVPQHSPALTVPAPATPEAATAEFRVEVLDAGNATGLAFATLPLPPTPAMTGPQAINATIAALLAPADGRHGAAPDAPPLDARLVTAFSVVVGRGGDAGAQNWLEALRLAARQGVACASRAKELLELAARAVRGLSPAFLSHELPAVVQGGLDTVGRVLGACAAPPAPREARPVAPGQPIRAASVRAAATAVLDALAVRMLRLTPALPGHRACLAADALRLCVVSGVPKGRAAVQGPGFAVTLPDVWPAHARGPDGRPLPRHADVGLGLAALAGSRLGTSSFLATLYAADGRPVALALPPAHPVALDLGLPFALDAAADVQCMYVDLATGTESGAGVRYVGRTSPADPEAANGTAGSGTRVQCATTHLTEFFVGYAARAADPPTPPEALPACPLPWVALGCWALYAAGLAGLRLCGAATRPAARSLWAHLLRFHDWVAVPGAGSHGGWRLTRLHVTVLGAMAGNLLLAGGPHALPLRALWALLLVLPVRGAMAALAQLPAPRPRRPCVAARGAYNPLQCPRTPAGGGVAAGAAAHNPLQRPPGNANGSQASPLSLEGCSRVARGPAGHQSPRAAGAPAGDARPAEDARAASGGAAERRRSFRQLRIAAPAPGSPPWSSAPLREQWVHYLDAGLGPKAASAADFSPIPSPRSPSRLSGRSLSGMAADLLDKTEWELDLLTVPSEEGVFLTPPAPGSPAKAAPPGESPRSDPFGVGGSRSSSGTSVPSGDRQSGGPWPPAPGHRAQTPLAAASRGLPPPAPRTALVPGWRGRGLGITVGALAGSGPALGRAIGDRGAAFTTMARVSSPSPFPASPQ